MFSIVNTWILNFTRALIEIMSSTRPYFLISIGRGNDESVAVENGIKIFSLILRRKQIRCGEKSER